MLRAARKPSRGFTIVELMIALVIIGIMAATIAPSLSEVLADNRQTSAAMDLVRAARDARSRAASSGLAVMLRYQGTTDGAGGNGLGTISTHVGINSKCMQTPWDQTLVPVAGDNQGRDRLLHMADYNPTDGETAPTADDLGRPVIKLVTRFASEAGAVRDETRICYQPNGEIYAAHSGAPLAIQVEPILIEIERTKNGAARGEKRQVLFPMGGNARLR